MIIKLGFVSNSSSCAFIVNLDNSTSENYVCDMEISNGIPDLYKNKLEMIIEFYLKVIDDPRYMEYNVMQLIEDASIVLKWGKIGYFHFEDSLDDGEIDEWKEKLYGFEYKFFNFA